ncbi:unnamed protein product [Linum trigynum]|uniref:Uncharacterized protein n=1 Tax=Linum trigynum TaxID=586398 RepID=A0AAV2ENJ2_9ROSI
MLPNTSLFHFCRASEHEWRLTGKAEGSFQEEDNTPENVSWPNLAVKKRKGLSPPSLKSIDPLTRMGRWSEPMHSR